MTKFEFIEWIKDTIPADADVRVTADFERKYDDKHRSDMIFFKGVSVEKKPIDKVEDEIEAFNI